MKRLLPTFLFLFVLPFGHAARGPVPDLDAWFGYPPGRAAVSTEEVLDLLGRETVRRDHWIPLDEWLGSIPPPDIRDPQVLDYYYKCWTELWLNLKQANGAWKEPALCPSILDASEALGLWETPFHVLGLVHGGAEAMEVAKNQIADLLRYPNREGRLALYVRPEGPVFHGENPAAPGLLSIAALEIYEHTKDWYFVEDCFGYRGNGALPQYNEWLQKHADPNRDGLLSWDAARGLFENSPVQLTQAGADLNLCCWFQQDREVLSRMGAILGLDSISRRWTSTAQDSRNRIREKMWHEEDGLFYDLEADGSPRRRKSLSCFLPLYTGITTDARAARMLTVLENAEFFRTEFPIPALSLDHPDFDPTSTWKGGTRVELNWMIIQGLRKYGYDEEANWLGLQTLSMIMRSPVCRETYNPLTGEGLGARHYGPTAALFIRLCHELIDQRHAHLAEVSISEYAATLIPPEDAIIAVSIRNPAEERIEDVTVELSSDISIPDPVLGCREIPPGGFRGFTFRVLIPPTDRGHRLFTATVRGRAGTETFHVRRNRVYTMREQNGCQLVPVDGDLVTGSQSKRITAIIRNYRIHPMGGSVQLIVPEGWTCRGGAERPFRFPFAEVHQEASFDVVPPADLTDGTHEICSRIRVHRDTIEGDCLQLFRPTRWVIAGPFDNQGGYGNYMVYPPEEKIDLDSAMPALEGETRWKILPDSANRLDGRVDLIGQFGRNEWATAYLATVLYSSGEKTAFLSIETSDPFAVWVNEKPLFSTGHRDVAAPDPLRVTLKGGPNTVLLKTCQGSGDWYFFFKLMDLDGKPLDGIRSRPEDLGGA